MTLSSENGPSPISVVMPAYNSAAMIDAALGSIAGQTLRPAEVVVVDDGSSDATAAVAARWSGVLPLEVVTLAKNAGPGNARNEGVRRASSSLLAFMDADDVWLPFHLEECAAIQRSSGGVAFGRALQWFADGRVVSVPPPDLPTAHQLHWIIRRNTLGMHAVMPRWVFDEVGGFHTGVEGAEDWDIWIRVARIGVPLRRVGRTTFLKRHHEGNLSGRAGYVAAASSRMLDRLDASLTDSERHEFRGAIREARASVSYSMACKSMDGADYRAARTYGRQCRSGPPYFALRGALLAASPRTWVRIAALRRSARSRLHRGTNEEAAFALDPGL
jgi:glycosyltransferase involved in cell wall biosynthesis